jgi:outer membrane protein assembly factor BamB
MLALWFFLSGSGTGVGTVRTLSVRPASADSLGEEDARTPKGFPTGPVLESLDQGPGSGQLRHRSFGVPVNPSWGPKLWTQEGGSDSRNPYFSAPLPPKTAPEKTASPPGADRPDPYDASGHFGLIGEDGAGAAEKSSGKVTWTRTFGTSPLDRMNYRFVRQPILVSGRVVLVSTRGQVLCLDAVTGETLWKRRLPASVWAPAVSDGQALYVVSGTPFVTAPDMMGYAQTRTIRRGNGPGHLFALSLATGKILWSAPTPGPALGSPVLARGSLWVTTGSGRLAGYSLEREKKVLEMPLASSSGWSSPLFVHNWLWLSLEGPTKLLALWPDRKRTVWALSVPPDRRLVLFTPTPSFGDKRLVTLFRSVRKGVPDEELAVVSAVTGHVFHQIPFSSIAPVKDGGAQRDLPPYARVYEGMAGVTVAGQTAVAASTLFGRAMAVDIPSGHLYWSAPLASDPLGPGTLAGGLYILPLRGRIEFFLLASGKEIGHQSLRGSPGAGSPPVIGSTLYVSGQDGTVRAISLERYRSIILPPPPENGSGTNQATAIGGKGGVGG